MQYKVQVMHETLKLYGEWSTVDGDEWTSSRPGRSIPWKEPQIPTA
jgi:hypothetical protein